MARVAINESVVAGRPMMPIPYASVQVNYRGAGAAPVYAAATGVGQLTNPVLSDQDGRVPGYLEEASYDYIVTKGDSTWTWKAECLNADARLAAMVDVTTTASAHAARHVVGGGDPIDWSQVVLSTNTAGKPSATGRSGMLVFVTDLEGGTIQRSNGTTWVTISSGLARPVGGDLTGTLPNPTIGANKVLRSHVGGWLRTGSWQATIGGSQTLTVEFVWGTAFADTNYIVVANLYDHLTDNDVSLSRTSGITATSFHARIDNGAGGDRDYTVHAIGIHA